ncbi:biotin/lipoate A/B protein ligase family protein [Porphyromonas catoniae]|jgi:lipoate--protein ligase|uniref:lipoate--protein ligase family protein n=1 Tax=Porphyromonas catoniae TaxID=41976 RepID=UPI0028D7DB85|nr:biotin/lipoate A/B protein ligase family protein [Porphyromonas catoniae]
MKKAYYYISKSNDPYYNITLEDYLYRQLRSLETIYFLWINRPSVFMGRYQHAEAELDVEYLQKRGIALLRRTSGGGTVYHDEGNLNFSVIKNGEESKGFDLAACPQPVQSALAKKGVEVVRSPRGDLRLDGLKVGGSAEAMTRGRLLYHICLLFDTDLEELDRILTVAPGTKARSRVASVRSKVTNLRPTLPLGYTIADFQTLILDELRGIEEDLTPLILDDEVEEYIRRKRAEQFEHPDWIHSSIGKAKES